MAHRARLSGSQTRGRARTFRRARLAWLPPPRYAVHRCLRIPGLREGDDSPLGISFHQAFQETCGFQRLPTQRLRHCDPNVTSRTRLRRCGEDSSLPSPGTSHAVPVALGNRSVFFCDSVRLGACPSSGCSNRSESDSSLGYEQVFSPLEYRSDTASAAECAGLRAEGPFLGVFGELGRESLDLKEITGSYVSGLGQPPFDPRMMVALLLHGYASGLYSSRRIAKACRERNDFVMIVALDPPDFRTISDFRKRHLKALGALFLQVLKLCETAGLVKLGHVALDGTKIKANASKHKAMSYERMKKREAELKAEVARMLAAAEAADCEEDETFGQDKRGDEMPDWAGDKQKRLAKIQQAMAALEADARLAAEEERRIEAEKEKQRQAEGRKKPGKPAAPPSEEPNPKAQRNFTDPESRIMKSKDGFVQAYNAQAAVDAGAQIIVAHELTQCGNDQGQLVPLIEAIANNLGRKPEQVSADSGYCSEANLEALEAHGVDGYVAPGRAKHPTAANGKAGGPLTQRMRKKIDDGGFETPYRLRKQVVEPVFGQIKQARGFRQFLLRGVEKVRAEWAMICTTHNVLKLFTLANAA